MLVFQVKEFSAIGGFCSLQVRIADRETVEAGIEEILDIATETEVALLIVGDPFRCSKLILFFSLPFRNCLKPFYLYTCVITSITL